MALSEDFKKFINKALPDFKVTDDTTEAEIDTAFGDAFILTSVHEADKKELKVQTLLKHETSLKKVIGDSAKGKTLEEMISTVLPEFLKNKENKIADLEQELKGSGKTTEEYEKVREKLKAAEASLLEAENTINTLTEEKENLTKAQDSKLNDYLFDQDVKKIYYEGVEFPEGKGWADGVDEFKKEGIWNRKIKDVAMPKRDEDGKIYAADPKTGEFFKDGIASKKLFSKFVQEVLVSDDVKAWKENGTTNKKLGDSKTPPPPVDKKEAHIKLQEELIDKMKNS